MASDQFSAAPFDEATFNLTRDVLNISTEYLGSRDLQGPNSWFQLPSPSDEYGLIIRLDKHNKAAAAFGLSLAFDSTSRTTAVALRVLLQTELDFVRNRVEKLGQYAWHPLLIPLILLEGRNADIPSELARHKDEIAELERKAGIYKNQYYADTLDFRSLSPTQGRDFDQILNDLLKIKNSLDYIMFKCETSLDLLEFLTAQLEQLSAAHAPSDPSWLTTTAIVKAKLAKDRVWAANSKARGTYVSQRCAALLAACYTLMARNDNWLNLEVAQASKRDSTDMRSIAVLTLVFLPATFVATFFSTGFYDFHVADDEIVSHWSWLFWVVSAVATLAVLLAWGGYRAYLARTERRREKTRERVKKGADSV